MEEEGRAAIAISAIRPEAIVVERAADMRYVGQEHAVTVELPGQFFEDKDRDAIKRRFDEVHAIRYGTSAPKEPADLVSLRTTVLGTMRKPPRHTVHEGEAEPPKEALRTRKDVFFRGQGFVSTPVFKRAALRSGNRVNGPALIEEHASTTVVAPSDVLTVDGFGNLQILIGSERK
jgi:N-methylhydantoinase A